MRISGHAHIRAVLTHTTRAATHKDLTTWMARSAGTVLPPFPAVATNAISRHSSDLVSPSMKSGLSPNGLDTSIQRPSFLTNRHLGCPTGIYLSARFLSDGRMGRTNNRLVVNARIESLAAEQSVLFYSLRGLSRAAVSQSCL